MKRARLQAATLGGTPDELENAFYEALHNADIDQLMACWAEEDEILCVQPGGTRLIGPGAIRSAFEALFAQGGVQAWPQQVHRLDALACAVHHLIEKVCVQTPQGERTAWVTVTHVYHKTPQGWRMVVHHASPGKPQEGTDSATRPVMLH